MRRRSSRFLLLLAVALSSYLFAQGCDRYARHKVLTFFFTGVPPLGEKRATEKKEAPGPKPEIRRAKNPVIRAVRFFHGPYTGGLCYRCHEVSESGGFRSLGKQEGAKGSFAKGGGIPGKLLAHPKKLCGSCHADRFPEKLSAAGVWVHGPVAAGSCLRCHGPHSAPEISLLLKKPDALCLECHGKTFDPGVPEHSEKKDCLSCHNPHFGRDRLLLKADLAEAW